MLAEAVYGLGAKRFAAGARIWVHGRAHTIPDSYLGLIWGPSVCASQMREHVPVTWHPRLGLSSL